MNLNSKKPEKRPLYVYYIIAVVIIVLLNVFALPALSDTAHCADAEGGSRRNFDCGRRRDAGNGVFENLAQDRSQ